MCATDFQHEMGEVEVKMYPTVEQLKREQPCVAECGIVSVNVEFVEWVQPCTLHDIKNKSKVNL